MKKGQDDFGNKVKEIEASNVVRFSIKDLEQQIILTDKFETGDFIRVYNKEGCVIATYVIKVKE